MTTTSKPARTPGPLTIDKDGSVRWDYYIHAESWEADEFIVTLGGEPVGRTLAAKDAKIVTQWLRENAERILARDQLISDLYDASYRDATKVADLVAALRKLHDAVDQQTAYAIKCKLEVIDHSYIMTVLSEARAALARATEGE